MAEPMELNVQVFYSPRIYRKNNLHMHYIYIIHVHTLKNNIYVFTTYEAMELAVQVHFFY